MRPPGQVGRDAPVVAMEVRAHAAPGVGVDAAPVDEHERRPGAPLPVLDRPRRDVDEAAFAELSADRHRFAFRASAGQLLADVERGAPLRLDAGDPEVLHRPGDPAREAVRSAGLAASAAGGGNDRGRSPNIELKGCPPEARGPHVVPTPAVRGDIEAQVRIFWKEAFNQRKLEALDAIT